MCRNIKVLFNFDPPPTDAEVHDAALQFVRKLSGFQKPSQVNAAAFNAAVDTIAHDARRLLDSLTTVSPHRDREVEAARAKARSSQRFGTS